MDERTNVQDVDVQDEVFDMNEPEMDMADFDAEDEEFDMGMEANNIAQKMFEEQLEEEKMLNDEGTRKKMAAKFSSNIVLTPPEDKNKYNSYISAQIAKKARRKA